MSTPRFRPGDLIIDRRFRDRVGEVVEQAVPDGPWYVVRWFHEDQDGWAHIDDHRLARPLEALAAQVLDQG